MHGTPLIGFDSKCDLCRPGCRKWDGIDFWSRMTAIRCSLSFTERQKDLKRLCANRRVPCFTWWNLPGGRTPARMVLYLWA